MKFEKSSLKSYFFQLTTLFLISMLIFSGCNSSESFDTEVHSSTASDLTVDPSPEPSPTPIQTLIKIDGIGDDWTERTVLFDDPGNSEEGYLDLGKGYALINHNALYFYVEAVDPNDLFVQFDIVLETDSSTFMIAWRPGESNSEVSDFTNPDNPLVVGKSPNSSIAFSSGIEGRVDLNDLPDTNGLVLAGINVLYGTCCEYQDWREVDAWGPPPTPYIDEYDAGSSTGSPPDQSQTKETRIVINGQLDDWEDKDILVVDPVGDAEPGYLDFSNGYAFYNQNALYFAIEITDSAMQYQQFDIFIETDSKSYLVNWAPGMAFAQIADVTSGFEFIGDLTNSQIVLDLVMEGRIDLGDLGSPTTIHLSEIGVLFDDGDGIRSVENWVSTNTPYLDEIDQSRSGTGAINTNLEQADTSFGPGIFGVRLDSAYRAEIIYQTQLVPTKVRIDSEDRIYASSLDGDTIFQVQANGEISVHFSQPGMVISNFDFDKSGNIWITTGGHQVYKLTPSGNLELVIPEGVNGTFWIDSNNNLIVVTPYNERQQILEITPDGNISVYAQDLDILAHALGLNDEVFILDRKGQVLEILPGGKKRTIASGFPYDSGIAVGPDGTLYVMEGGINEVDVITGKKRRIDWVSDKYWQLGWDAVFNSAGQMFIHSGNEGAYKIDFQKETVIQIRNPLGNTQAMTTDSNGNIYLAYGDGLPEGTTSVFQIENRELILIGTIPGGLSKGLASADLEALYVATEDSIYRGNIYKFNTQTGDYEFIIKTQDHINSLLVDQLSGFIWWSNRYDQVYYLDGDGNLNTIPVPVPAPNDIFLDIGVDGILYAIIWGQRPTDPGPGPHSLYQLKENGEWEELADMTTEDPGVYWALPVACPDAIYSIASVDGITISPDRTSPSFNAVLRFEKDGKMTVIGYDFSADTKAAICDSSTGDIILTHFFGVYRLIRDDNP